MIHKLILNTANYSSKNTNSSVKFLVNFGFLDPHKHYKCSFAFHSHISQIDNTIALLSFSGGPLAYNYSTSSTSANGYLYSPILGTVYSTDYVVTGSVVMGSLRATTNDNTPVIFAGPPQQSEVHIQLLNQDGSPFVCAGGVPEWVLTLSFQEYDK